MTIELRPRLRFRPVFKAVDTLFLATKHYTDEDGQLTEELVYAYSDGTMPYDCNEGPYIIHTDAIRQENAVWLQPSSVKGSPMVGAVPAINGFGRHFIGRPTLGVTMELMRRLGITQVGVHIEYESGTDTPGILRLKGHLF